MTEPINCPICGKRPLVKPVNPDDEGNAWGEVVCHQDDHHLSILDGEEVADERGSDAYKEAAILRWNGMSYGAIAL
jgi:DNA-directed RNA polymerase subunit RPC12/RpoP